MDVVIGLPEWVDYIAWQLDPTLPGAQDVPRLINVAAEMVDELERVRYLLENSDATIIEWPDGTAELQTVASIRTAKRIEELLARWRGEVESDAVVG